MSLGPNWELYRLRKPLKLRKNYNRRGYEKPDGTFVSAACTRKDCKNCRSNHCACECHPWPK